jgi:acetyl esterase/lipase
MNDETFRGRLKNFKGKIVEDVPFSQVVNSEGQEETLHLDLYLPPGESLAFHPAIIWFHGGGFRPGHDKRQIYIPRFASALAALGYAGIAPDYRVRADPTSEMRATVQDAVKDGRAAWNWVREHGPEHHIDPGRIALAGGSAGGMLVLNLVHDPSAPFDAKKDGVFALLDLWGTPGGEARLFERVNTRSPATLIVHGTADALVPYAWSEHFSLELSEAGVENRLLTLADAPHTPLMHMDQIVAEAAQFFAIHQNP